MKVRQKKQLINELVEMRRQITELEKIRNTAQAGRGSAKEIKKNLSRLY